MFQQRRKVRILVADDIRDVRRDLRRLLEIAGAHETPSPEGGKS